MAEEENTTISVSIKNKERINAFKAHPRETHDETLTKILDKAEVVSDE